MVLREQSTYTKPFSRTLSTEWPGPASLKPRRHGQQLLPLLNRASLPIFGFDPVASGSSARRRDALLITVWRVVRIGASVSLGTFIRSYRWLVVLFDAMEVDVIVKFGQKDNLAASVDGTWGVHRFLLFCGSRGRPASSFLNYEGGFAALWVARLHVLG
jgi:hypothetical protein